MIVSIRMSEKERQLAEEYAKRSSVSLSEAMKKAFFEKIEDEYDIALTDATLREHEKDPKSYSHEEIMKMFDL